MRVTFRIMLILIVIGPSNRCADMYSGEVDKMSMHTGTFTVR